MGQITSLFVRKVLGEVDDDIDKSALMHSVGINPDGPVDSTLMVPALAYYTFLEQLTTLDRNPATIPLRAGAAMRCDGYGACGLAWKTAPRLRGSYERAVRYARVLTSVSSYELEPASQGAYMHLHRSGERRLGMRLSNEATIASIVSISREVSDQPFKPIAVYFKHAGPDNMAAHEAYFQCPVHFESERDALLVSHASLNTPNHLGDESVSRFFDTHLEAELSKFEDKISLEQRVRIQISRSLSEGAPGINDVAMQLGTSGRTLQRRLSDLGCSFQTLVDDTRRQLARRLLKETDYTLAEIAFMTGYAEQSAFTRAFKRWAGQTPRSFRLDIPR